MGLFQELNNISKPGVYILKHPTEKICFIGYSSNVLTALNRNINSNLVTSDYLFELLEIVTEQYNLRPRCQFWMDKYSNNNYNIINKRVSSLKLHADVLQDFRTPGSKDLLFYVKIVSKGYKSFVVGVFSTYGEVESFTRDFYSNKQIYKIVTADNDLTKEYNGR